MRALSYAVFRHPSAETFEYRAYVRGMCFNLRMNKLLYPGWDTAVCVDGDTAARYGDLFTALGATVTREAGGRPLCEAMLWRMKPIFSGPDGPSESPRYTHLLCRDADAITTYREAAAVTEWVASGATAHAIHDDPQHTAHLMGGMSGFECQKLRAATGYTSWRGMIASSGDLSERGSAQTALAKHIYPKLRRATLKHDLTGGRSVRAHPEGVDPRLWESDLTCRHIGSPGVVEMETIRFFKRFDPAYDGEGMEKRYPEIFYWHG